ncbi:hypothetical protein Agub_g12513 [Astrephomene gubernaculifera]|uniref:Glutathione S-transferase n=1 Tax=Astrephomene gubernaculifera TaxID=47775 RepID=A0AAD3E0D0_9CHLO|nr:hypothetical protein Agub_g12513 [Astrephomene gubernaculifera]
MQRNFRATCQRQPLLRAPARLSRPSRNSNSKTPTAFASSKATPAKAMPAITRLELYDDPHSEYSAKVKVAMHAKGLCWATLPVPCGGTRSPDFLAINPLGKIPVLCVTFDDGRRESVFESEVILELLEELFPQPPLLPAEPLARSKARLISRYHDLYLEPALRRLYGMVAPSGGHSKQEVQEAVAAFTARLSELESLLPPDRTLALTDDNQLTLADCGYPALFLYTELLLPVLLGRCGRPSDGCSEQQQVLPPRLRRWRTALWGHPAVQAVLAELRPAAEEWLAGRSRS